MTRRRTQRNPGEAWPGYVDMLSTLLLVIVFLLIVFVLAQFFLAQTLSGRNEQLQRLSQQVSELADLLSLEKKANADLRTNVSQLTASLQKSGDERDAMAGQLDTLRSQESGLRTHATELEQQLAAAQALRAQAEKDLKTGQAALSAATGKAAEAESKLTDQQKISAEALAQVALLNQQVLALRQQLAELEKALDVSEAKDKQAQATIADLGRRLNLALAKKVEELAQYRSEFFGRLRELLGNRPDITIVGDRFVFQSEVLFPQGSDELNESAKQELKTLASTLLEIAKKIPKDLPWILRVDGHTDAVPIHTAQFPSNWELSTARAVAVVKYLTSEGVAADRLAATGFGEFHPLDTAQTPDAYRRNRRIELKLTER